MINAAWSRLKPTTGAQQHLLLFLLHHRIRRLGFGLGLALGAAWRGEDGMKIVAPHCGANRIRFN